MKRLLPLILLQALSGACATAPVADPSGIASSWLSAAAAGDASSGRALLVAGAPLWPAAGPPPAIDAGEPVESLREARWRLADGRPLVIVSRQGRLEIAAGVLGFRRASTPSDAALLLARALHQQDWALLHGLLPASERWRWTADQLATALTREPTAASWRALADAIVAGPLSTEWLEPGVRARVAVGERVLIVVSEDEGWKVFDVQPAGPYTPSP